MTNKLEKQFFDTFGIEQREYAQCCSLGCKKSYTDCINCQYREVYKIDYPQITNSILLKLICYLSRYNFDLVPKHACFKTTNQLKNHVLECALKFKSANSVPMFYSQDLQKLFKEV